MARISSYAIDGTVDNMDKLLGSTQDGTTANYTADIIGDYFTRYAGAEAAKHGQTYDFGGTLTGTDTPSDSAGKIYVYSPAENPSLELASITSIVVSKTTNAGISADPILKILAGNIVKIAGATQGGATSYALYTASSYQEYPYGGDLVQLDLTLVESAGGNINDDPYSAVVLSAAGHGEINLDGIISNVQVETDAATGTYTLRLTPSAGSDIIASWLDVNTTILSGTDTPIVGLGKVGDFYIRVPGPDNAIHFIYGPKTSGGWGAATRIDGYSVGGVETISGGVNPGEPTVIQFMVNGVLIDNQVTIQPGVDGVDGANGVSIVDVTINSDNDLIVTLSDGTELNAGTFPDQLKVDGTAVANADLISAGPITFNVAGSLITPVIDDATTSASGLMSAADKTKLDGIATGADANVQSDWNETDTSSDAFIQNKPTNLTEFGSGSGQVATWAEGNNTDTIPADKLDISAFEVHTYVGDYDDLKAETGITFNLGDLYVLTPGNGEYIFIGTDGTTGPTDDNDWNQLVGNTVNLGTSVTASSVTITNSDGTNATINAASSTDAGLLTPTRLNEIDVNTGKTGVTFGSSAQQIATWAEGNNTDDVPVAKLPNASATSDGIITAAQFAQIGTGDANVQSNWNETDTASDAFIQNKPTTITAAQATNITNSKAVTDAIDATGFDADNKFVLADADQVSIPASVDSTDPDALGITINDTTYKFPFNQTFTQEGADITQEDLTLLIQDGQSPSSDQLFLSKLLNGSVTVEGKVATSTLNGLMANTDKSKLDGIATGAEVNVQSDWNATSGDAFISNKPLLAGESGNPQAYGFISDADKTKLDGIEAGATATEANPDGMATDTLESIDVSGTIYTLPSGTTVEANTDNTPTEELENIEVDGTTYSVSKTQVSFNGTELEDPNFINSSDSVIQFAVTAGTNNVSTTIADATTSSRGLMTGAQVTQQNTNTTGIAANMGSISALETEVDGINSFDPANTGAADQILTRAGDGYQWADTAYYPGLNVTEGSVTASNLTGLTVSGDGITLTDNGDGTATLTFTGGGGGSDSISIQTFSLTVPTNPNFFNVTQAVTAAATWTVGSNVTFAASSISFTQTGNTIDSLTIPASADGSFTDSSTMTSFENASNQVNTLSATLTLNGTDGGNAITPVTMTIDFDLQELVPTANANPLTSPVNFELTPDTSGSTIDIEAHDSGQYTALLRNTNTGWALGDTTFTGGTGLTYTQATQVLAIDLGTTSQTASATTAYTQSSVPSGKTAQTASITSLESTSFNVIKSFRYGCISSATKPSFTDDSADGTGLRNLSSFNSGDNDIIFKTVDPSDVGSFNLGCSSVNSGESAWWYMITDSAQDDIVTVEENGFPYPLTNVFDSPQTVGGYKTYISSVGKPVGQISITGLTN